MQFSIRTFLAALVAVGLGVGEAQAQHSDVEFGYNSGMIEIEPGPDGLVFESDMPTGGIFEGFSSDPGFGSELIEGLGIGANDAITYNLLDNLFFWNEATEGFDDPGSTTISIDNAVGADTLVSASSGMLIPGGVIGQASGTGDFHSHVAFQLSSGAPIGAYGLLLELETDDLGIAKSDPFFIVFNFGLDEAGTNPSLADLEDAMVDFGAHLETVPEPSSMALGAIGAALLGCGVLRRRRTVGCVND